MLETARRFLLTESSDFKEAAMERMFIVKCCVYIMQWALLQQESIDLWSLKAQMDIPVSINKHYNIEI